MIRREVDSVQNPSRVKEDEELPRPTPGRPCRPWAGRPVRHKHLGPPLRRQQPVLKLDLFPRADYGGPEHAKRPDLPLVPGRTHCRSSALRRIRGLDDVLERVRELPLHWREPIPRRSGLPLALGRRFRRPWRLGGIRQRGKLAHECSSRTRRRRRSGKGRTADRLLPRRGPLVPA